MRQESNPSSNAAKNPESWICPGILRLLGRPFLQSIYGLVGSGLLNCLRDNVLVPST
jgi:hypothetical protein